MAGWDKLAQNIAKLADIPSVVSNEIANGINELIQKQFDEGKDPYNFPWKPLAPSTIARKGNSNILIETAKLRASTKAEPISGGGINLVSIDYGMFHQDGTRFMPKRPVLPYGNELPTSWQRLIQQILDTITEEVIEKGKDPQEKAFEEPKAEMVAPKKPESKFEFPHFNPLSLLPKFDSNKPEHNTSKPQPTVSNSLSIPSSESASGKGKKGGGGSQGSGSKKKKSKKPKSLIKKRKKK